MRLVRVAIAVLIMKLFVPSLVGAQVTANVFERVLNVRVNGHTQHPATATAFTLDVDGRQYIITAKHVVAGLKGDDTIEIFLDGDWKDLSVKIFRCEDPTDIAVLIPPHQMTVNFELPAENLSLFVGQDAYSLDFPTEFRFRV